MEKVAMPKTPNADLMAQLVQQCMMPAAIQKLASYDITPESEDALTKCLVIGNDVADAVDKRASQLRTADPLDTHAQKVASMLQAAGAISRNPRTNNKMQIAAAAALA